MYELNSQKLSLHLVIHSFSFSFHSNSKFTFHAIHSSFSSLLLFNNQQHITQHISNLFIDCNNLFNYTYILLALYLYRSYFFFICSIALPTLPLIAPPSLCMSSSASAASAAAPNSRDAAVGAYRRKYLEHRELETRVKKSNN